mgnify:CR=1 FL=1
MIPVCVRILRIALLILLGVASVQLFGWECSTRPSHLLDEAAQDALPGGLDVRMESRAAREEVE